MQTAIDCVLMRGGTSRGPVFRGDSLPTDPNVRDRVLIAALGSPHELQVDGLGGANSLTSKVAIVSTSMRAGCDVDYLFAQVNPVRAEVDTRPNCGNMLAAAAPFAIEQGLVSGTPGETVLRVHNVNTGSIIEAVVCTPECAVSYEGDVQIDGVNGTAAPVRLNFVDGWGGLSGSIFPTGHRQEFIHGVRVTCIDAVIPLVLIHAEDVGTTATEKPEALNSNPVLRGRIEAIRIEAGRRMGFGDVSRSVVPKPVLVSIDPFEKNAIRSRYFTPHACHASHAVTGAIGVAAASKLAGTVLSITMPTEDEGGEHQIKILHPAGQMSIHLETAANADGISVRRAGVVRTARKIMQGQVFVPSALFK